MTADTRAASGQAEIASSLSTDAGARACGAVAAGIFLLLVLLTGGRGMDMGDAKLAVFVGLAVGCRTSRPPFS